MAKLTDRTELTTPADGDLYVTTDVSDTTDAATGTDKKITWANLKAGFKAYFDTLYGNVSKVGTPVNNQVGVWTGDGTLEGDTGFTFDGGLNITVADAENKVGLTITQLDTTNEPAALKIVATGINYPVIIENANPLTTGAFTKYYQNSVSPAAGDFLGGEDFYGNSSTGVERLYADFNGKIIDATNGAEYGSLVVETVKNGAAVTMLEVGAESGSAINGISVGQGGTSVVSSRGDYDLVLQTGNATTGNITIVDGADGQISLNPNGTGTVKLGTLTGVLRADTGVVSADTDVTDIVAAASDTAAGKVELAIVSEVNTGTDATRAVTPDALAGSYAGTKSLSVQVYDGTTDVATGDGKAYITIPEALNGMNLVRAQATVVTAGTTNATTVMIHNKTDTQDMLSGAISIASGGTVGTVGTVNGSFDDVATNDVLRIDVDSVSTTAPKGLMVVLEFRLP